MTNPYGVELHIGHDLDGNLGNWEGAVKRALIAKGFDIPTEPATSWNAWLDWGLTTEQFFDEYAKLLKAGLLSDVEVLPGQVEFLGMCAQRGHKNFIVTNRLLGVEDRASQFDTLKWINEKLSEVQIDGVIFSADKAVIATDIFYDDSVDNINRLLEAGCPHPVLVDQPYNFSETALDPIRCANTATDKMAIVLRVEAIMAGFVSPAELLGHEANFDGSLLEPAREAMAALAASDTDPNSAEGQLALDRAYEAAADELLRSQNAQLRAK